MKFRRLILVLALIPVFSLSITADEGMYPLSELYKLDLRKAGLRVSAREIFNPDGPSLVDAICQVGGGTGEFVSPQGLILTNHHIAFSAIADASTPEHDYLSAGFTAHTRDQEVPAKGYVCRITESYRDVSKDILRSITPDTPPAERSRTISERMKSMAAEEAKGRENIVCEVSEMFPGVSYVLFTYRTIRDVRLVYAPPRSIGEYGGEDDNWVWPRHTGDFSFLRAYVAPDGRTAPFAKENVPYIPKRYIKVAKRGVTENDVVFILGYPGRTYRHKPARYIELYERTILPLLSARYDWMIETMQRVSKDDRALQLALASEIKSLANATKNYKGKMQGLRRLHLVEKRRKEEQDLQAFIAADPIRSKRYGTTLQEISRVYADYEKVAPQEITQSLLGRNDYMGPLFMIAGAITAGKTDEKSRKAMRSAVEDAWAAMDTTSQRVFLAGLLCDAAALPEAQRVPGILLLTGPVGTPAEREAAGRKLTELVPRSVLASKSAMLALTELSKDEFVASMDPFVAIARQFAALGETIAERRRVRDGELNRLESELLEARMAWQKRAFIPDANSTLRFTFGRVRGYSPADATHFSPQTTLRGVVEKNTGREPFNALPELVALHESRSYSRSFMDAILKDVPVAMLYDTDTTGGNSGSPVMNAAGELVGVNFDRAWEATINDYQWSEEYSRSIGADIRYILFVAKYIGKADFLLKELGV